MLRRGVEDKAATAEEYVEYDGRRYGKEDFSDDGRTVRARTNMVDGLWDAARRLGLMRWDGRPIQTFSTMERDQLVQEASPALRALREKVAATWKALEEIRTRNAAKLDRIAEAERERAREPNPNLTIDELTLARATEKTRSSFVLFTRDMVAQLESEEEARRAVAAAEMELKACLDAEEIRRSHPHECRSCGLRVASLEQLETHQRDHGANRANLTIQTIGTLTRR